MANAEHIGGFPKPEKGTHWQAGRERRQAAKDARKAKGPLQKVRAALDTAGSDQVRARSEGRCEVHWFGVSGRIEYRCDRRAVHVHHMIGGRGKRGIGVSALAEHKQHVCDECHREIGGDVGGKTLKRIGGVVPHWTDRYARVERRSR